METARYNTRVIVLVHSNQTILGQGAVDCSPDVINLQTSKTIKGSGAASFDLVPRRNYINLLFPDDVVNIYIDPGDGVTGFVRTFFGYIDRVGRTEKVGDQGQMNTAFHVTCTDFVKAIDKTEIYFNPPFGAREDILGAFGQSQIGGGHALRTSGITAYGTPSQFVENLLQLLVGFGEQWVLPSSYKTTGGFSTSARRRRQQRAKGFLPEDVKNQLYVAFNTKNLDSIGLDQTVEQQLLAQQSALNQQIANAPDPSVFDAQKAALSALFTAQTELETYQTMLRESQQSSSLSLIDLLAFDFIEQLCIDGFISDVSVWTNQGTLSSFLYGWSNEIVNELCFDLRPVAAGDSNTDARVGDGSSNTVEYSKTEDELGINVHGTDFHRAGPAGIQYAPAVIMREYPHSVVEGLDLSSYTVLGASVGYQPFGPVFSQGIGNEKSGRVLYNYQDAGIATLAPVGCQFADGKPQKHLDVVKIFTSDMTDSDVARSDADIFNLFELYSEAPNIEMWKFELAEILPILTPVSIRRHGMRLRTANTKFANYSRDQLCHSGGSAIDNSTTRRNLVRWALLMDHWYQHNIEYLSGTINLRGMPEIRVGYRLDWVDRHESYYVESVNHQWSFPGVMRTTVQVSRGQRNDPFPVYIPPALVGLNSAAVPAGGSLASVQSPGGGDRTENGRLGTFFPIMDTPATANATHLNPNAQLDAGFPFPENDIDQRGNVVGFAIYPGDAANRPVQAGGSTDPTEPGDGTGVG